MSGGNRARVRLSNDKGVCKVGSTVHFVVEAQIVSTISVRGVFAHLIGYEQVCWKKTDTPNQSNAVRHTIHSAELLVHGDAEGRPNSLTPGTHAFPGHFLLPESLRSSFTLSEHNAHSGVFYVLEAEFRTITRLRSPPLALRVEGLLRNVALERDCMLSRSVKRSLIGAGNVRMTVRLHRSILTAGDVLRFDVDIANDTQRHFPCLVVTLKQQLELISKANKRIDACERVFFVKDDDIRNAPLGASYQRTLEFTIPADLPQTQTTEKGLIAIEYHVNVTLQVPWSMNIRVRLPLAILQKTSFPELLSPREADRVRRSSFVSPPPVADQQYAPPAALTRHDGAAAAAAVYTPAPARSDNVYTPAPAVSRASAVAKAPGSPVVQKLPGSPVVQKPLGSVVVQKPPGSPVVTQPQKSSGNLSVPGAPAAAQSLQGYGLAAPRSPRRGSVDGFGSLVESRDGSEQLEPGAAEESAPLGYVAAEDVAAFQRAETYFKHWDRDGNGWIDRDEFKALHADLVKNGITALSLSDAWANLDADGDGTITFNEYVDFLIGVGSLRPPPDETVLAVRPRRDSFLFEADMYPYVMTQGDQQLSARGLPQH
jgi:hypothetical protein